MKGLRGADKRFQENRLLLKESEKRSLNLISFFNLVATRLATALIGYDTETGSNVETAYEPVKTLEKSITALVDLHVRKEVPATFFIVGKTIEIGHRILSRLKEHRDLFDIQQHTYSHLPLKSIFPQSEAASINNDLGVKGGSIPRIAKEIRRTNELIAKFFDTDCTGLRGPWGYYLGLTDRKDVLGVLDQNGIKFTSTFLRNRKDFFPVPMSVQPFTYEAQGFPEIREIPSQDWIDCEWRTVYGWGRTRAFAQHMIRVLEKISTRKTIWGTCFHDWSTIIFDPKLSIMDEFFDAARQNKVELKSYGEYDKENR